MSSLTKKYLLTTLAIFIVFSAGVIVGCSKDQFKTSQAQPSHKVDTMPDNLKGVHTVPAVGSIDVAFSPEGGITNMLIGELNAAKKTIHVQAYSFTSNEIIKALIDAKKRGVDVKIIIDKSNADENNDSSNSKKEKARLDSIVDSGIPLKIDRGFQIAHSKIMIIDGVDVITGSFNFSAAAEHSNAENCLIIHDNTKLADTYEANWQWRWNSTDAYTK
ncbi:MAG: phospholipase D/transphosphatidylase [Firmicutes bacterium]|nr:phospholipase D/transphosphatidylase [Bacillota bacterium]